MDSRGNSYSYNNVLVLVEEESELLQVTEIVFQDTVKTIEHNQLASVQLPRFHLHGAKFPLILLDRLLLQNVWMRSVFLEVQKKKRFQQQEPKTNHLAVGGGDEL